MLISDNQNCMSCGVHIQEQCKSCYIKSGGLLFHTERLSQVLKELKDLIDWERNYGEKGLTGICGPIREIEINIENIKYTILEDKIYE